MKSNHCLLQFLAFLVISVSDLCIGDEFNKSQLAVGRAFNIFKKHGYLEESMRVIPNDDNFEEEKWLLKLPTTTIFKSLNDLIEIREENNPETFHFDFRMKLCDDRRQLYQAYFRDFKIELLDRPWEVFTGGWNSGKAAKKLGINSSFIRGDYSYILVRIERFRETNELKSQIPPNQPLADEVIERKRQLTVGNVSATVKFLESFGTHYINSYTTGNSLYQVFVYNRTTYQIIKNSIKSKGIHGLSKSDYYEYFGPWYAEHLGKIRSASANQTVERWAQRQLQQKFSFFSFQTLLVLNRNGTLQSELDNLLGNEAVLKIELKSLIIIFKDDAKKQKWFEEILDNHKRLWEENVNLNSDCEVLSNVVCRKSVLKSAEEFSILFWNI